MSAGFMGWDHRGQPNIDELDRIVANMSVGLRHGAMLRVHAVEDTGTDDYGIVITDEDLTSQQVGERWRAWWAAADEQ
jgi:hypothetical protein